MKMQPTLAAIALIGLCFTSKSIAAKNPDDSLMLAHASHAYYQGLLDLPKQGFHYAMDGISKEESLDFTQYAVSQIYLHPDKAKAYACQLQGFLGEGPLHDEIVKNRQEKSEMEDYMRQKDQGVLDIESGFPSSKIQSSMLLGQHPYPDMDKSSIMGSVIDGLGSLLRFILTVFILVSVMGVTAGIVIYLIARSRGTTFTLTLKRDELTTEF